MNKQNVLTIRVRKKFNSSRPKCSEINDEHNCAFELVGAPSADE